MAAKLVGRGGCSESPNGLGHPSAGPNQKLGRSRAARATEGVARPLDAGRTDERIENAGLDQLEVGSGPADHLYEQLVVEHPADAGYRPNRQRGLACGSNEGHGLRTDEHAAWTGRKRLHEHERRSLQGVARLVEFPSARLFHQPREPANLPTKLG